MKQAIGKLTLTLLAIALLASCGAPGAPMPPSLELPKPVRDLRANRKGDKVYLTWTVPTVTTARQTVRYLGPTRVCRSLQPSMSECGTPIDEIAAPGGRFSSSKNPAARQALATYVDTLSSQLVPHATDEATYAVEVLNEDQRSAGLSNQVHVPLVSTLPPPANFTAEVTAKGVQISWSCAPSPASADSSIQYRLRVYRRAAESQTESRVGEGEFVSCSHSALLDPTFEWEKTYDYFGTPVTMVSEPGQREIQLEGDDTPAVRVFAHDVFPPAVPAGLQAVFSGAGQQPFIDLIWTPDTDADLAGYNVYRHEEGSPPTKLNSEPVKTPAFRDANVTAGKRYFYSVSAVDLRGNESTRSEEASETAP